MAVRQSTSMKAEIPTDATIRAWQRTSPAYEHLVRLARVFYIFALVIIQIPVIAVDQRLKTNYYGRPSWGFGFRLFRLFLGYIIWATKPGTRPLLDVVSDSARSAVGRLGKGQHAELVVVPPRPDKLYEDALHPGIEPDSCPCFWQWLSSMPSPVSSSEPMHSRKVFLYFVGGGMVQGHPVQNPLPWLVMEITRIPVFGVNFRKCVTANLAFPAALQDAVAAFFYLLGQGFKAENVCMLGDSGGACIVFTTLLYLKKQTLPLPGSTILVSPWFDLVDTFQEDKLALKLDMLNPDGLSMAAYQYTENRPDLRPTLLSPSRNQLPDGYSFEGLPRIMLVYGEVEMFAGSVRELARLCREKGVKVELLMGKEDIHVYPCMTKDRSEDGFFGRLLPFVNGDGRCI